MSDYGRELEFGVSVEPLANPPGWAAREGVPGRPSAPSKKQSRLCAWCGAKSVRCASTASSIP